MAHKPYTHRWCAVKGDTSWHFTTKADAEAKAKRVSEGEQADVYELVGGQWVWRSCVLTALGTPGAALIVEAG